MKISGKGPKVVVMSATLSVYKVKTVNLSTGVKTTGQVTRGNGAATKGTRARGPMA